MPSLKVRIAAKSPLVFSERRPDGQFRPGAGYVPGAVIRGSLAQQMLDAGVQPGGADFSQLFLAQDRPLFRNAYIGRLLPVTAMSCKVEPGFSGHGVFDSLIDRLCCEALGVADVYQPRCRECKGRVEIFGGWYTTADGRPRSVEVPTHLTTRVGINRSKRVAEEGLLYSPVVMSEARTTGNGIEPTVFEGEVSLADASRPLLEEWLPRLTHVGSGASRGFGQVEVTCSEAPTPDPSERLQQFNERLRRRADAWARACRVESLPSGTYWAVMLVADAILLQDGWAPTTRLTPDLLGTAGQGASLERSYATAVFRGGWNSAWGLPKDTQLAVRMGSLYVFHSKSQPDDHNWRDRLRELEERGVGDRRYEGFGQVKVCDEFHMSLQEEVNA